MEKKETRYINSESRHEPFYETDTCTRMFIMLESSQKWKNTNIKKNMDENTQS
jgi:hypothetical protein